MTLGPQSLRRISGVLFAVCMTLLVVSLVLGVAQVVIGSPHPEGDAVFAAGFIFLADGLVLAAVGAVIIHRQPRNTIGWLLMAVAVSWALGIAVAVYSDYGVNVAPGSVPGPVLVHALLAWTWVPAVGLMAIFVPLLFPDGHVPSPGWRWLAWLAGVVMTVLSLIAPLDEATFDETALEGQDNPIDVSLPAAVDDLLGGLFLIFVLCMVASAASAVLRYRRSTGVERAQMKWLVTAGAVFASFFTGSLFASILIPFPTDFPLIDMALPVVFALFPLAIGASILKYRLYEIDVVISRSLVFGALAVFITVIYVGIVVGIGHLVGSGDRPNLALSVAATAIIAVAFEPVRERLQRVANRLVYGERATPYEVLSNFADRMGGAYDAAELLPLMARAVGQGVDAERSQVWLQRGDGFELAATWNSSEGSAASPHIACDGLESIEGDRVTEVRDRGETLGAIAIVKRVGKELTPVEERLLETLSAQAGPVLRNVRLIEDLRSSRRRLVATQDEERRRLERNLHDGAQQSLVALALMLRLVQSKVTAQDAGAGDCLERASEELGHAVEELRDLARGIYPVVLTERGLGAALSSLAERLPVPIVVQDRLATRAVPEIERALYFIAFEALTGADRAGAHEAVVRLDHSDDVLSLRVDDDGSSLDDPRRGLARQNLLDRAAVVDATLEIGETGANGLHLVCTVPVVDVAPTGEAGKSDVTAVPIGAGQ